MGVGRAGGVRLLYELRVTIWALLGSRMLVWAQAALRREYHLRRYGLFESEHECRNLVAAHKHVWEAANEVRIESLRKLVEREGRR